jgi:outer membrane protein assembly factor BamB
VVVADYSSEPGTVRVESLAHDPKTGLFFLGAGKKLHAVDVTGRERWSLPHANSQWTEPMACDGSLYVYDTAVRTAYKYNPAGPQMLWKCLIGARQGYLSRGTDDQGDDLVFVAGWFDETRSGSLTAIYDRGAKAGTPKWGPIQLDHPIKSVSLWEGHDCLLIPAMNGKLVWRRASTGELIREAKLSAAANGPSPWAQVVTSAKYGIVMSHDDNVRDNHLFVFDLETGQELWRSAPTDGSGACMIPILSGGIAVTGTYSTGIWYAFRLGHGEQVPFSRFGNERNTGFVAGGLAGLGEKSATLNSKFAPKPPPADETTGRSPASRPL